MERSSAALSIDVPVFRPSWRRNVGRLAWMEATQTEGNWEGKYQGFRNVGVWLLVFQVLLETSCPEKIRKKIEGGKNGKFHMVS